MQRPLPSPKQLVAAFNSRSTNGLFAPQDDLLKRLVAVVFRKEDFISVTHNDGKTESESNTGVSNTVIPKDGNVIVALSGGAGSTASLWVTLVAGVNPAVVHVQSLFEDEIAAKREVCVESIAVKARTQSGMPLATFPERIPWLSTIRAPKNATYLNKRARVALIISLLREALHGDERKTTIVWGQVHDAMDVFEAMEAWGFVHACPFPGYEEALFSLATAEVVSATLCAKYPPRAPNEIFVGASLFPTCTDVVCSCWEEQGSCNIKNTSKSAHDSKTILPVRRQTAGLAAMCGKCNGCAPWFDAKESLRRMCPSMWMGSQTPGSAGEREWCSLPTLRKEPRLSSGHVLRNGEKLPPFLQEREQSENPDSNFVSEKGGSEADGDDVDVVDEAGSTVEDEDEDQEQDQEQDQEEDQEEETETREDEEAEDFPPYLMADLMSDNDSDSEYKKKR